jgi:voltage-gated potassium channel
MKLSKNIIFNIIIIILVALDSIFLLAQVFYRFSSEYSFFLFIFDISICIILWISFIFEYKDAKDKKSFLKHNWYYIFALIPDSFFYFLGISHFSGVIRLIILFRIWRVIILLRSESKFLSEFLAETYIDKLLIIVAIFALVSSLLLFTVDKSITSFWEALWYVVVTLSTVGYGDVIPHSFWGRIIGFILLFVGVLLFSILTGSMSYFYSKRIESKTRRDIVKTRKDLIKRISNLEHKINEIHSILTESKKDK